MKLEWKEKNNRLGFYELTLKDDNGNTVRGSELSFVDYTVDAQRKANKNNPKLQDVAYSWQWCCEYLHSEDYLFSEGLTLEQAQKRAEDWLTKMFMEKYDAACATVQMLKPFVENLRAK